MESETIDKKQKRGGRPPGALGRHNLTEEEKKQRKKIYDLKYQYNRYNNDEDYRTAIRNRQKIK